MWIKVRERLPDALGRYRIRDVKGKEDTAIFMTQFQAFLYDKKILEWWQD